MFIFYKKYTKQKYAYNVTFCHITMLSVVIIENQKCMIIHCIY